MLDQVLESGCMHQKFFEKSEKYETETSRMIKVLAEVEKIWIIYDIDDSGALEFQEIEQYLRTMAFPKLDMSM